LVFAVKNRQALIQPEFREEYIALLQRYEIDFKDEYLFEV